MNKNFFNLIDDDITNLSIEKDGYYQCVIKNKNGVLFDGFILAKSTTGKAITICEIDFQKSSTDKKCHPRLTFKRTDSNFKENNVRSGSLTQRITFQKGDDGYKEFWKMISFLKGFKELVDTGNFDDEYRVTSKQEFLDYIKEREKANEGESYEDMVKELGMNSTSAVYFLTTIKLLRSYKEKIEEFIDNKAKETDVQKWIDEDKHEHRQDRCMIFGLEFVNHKREGGASGDRYDIFTRIGTESEERVLIELKSPSDEVFEAKEHKTNNDIKKEYSLSPAISRAIPQILEYRKTLEEKRSGDPELQKIGENGEVKISKCIIVIGAENNDERWKKNLREFRRSLSANLEIWTYTDLLNKLDSIIKNLENRK